MRLIRKMPRPWARPHGFIIHVSPVQEQMLIGDDAHSHVLSRCAHRLGNGAATERIW